MQPGEQRQRRLSRKSSMSASTSGSLFVFPGILGCSFNLPPEQIAYLYGMTFLVCGFVTMLLRLPIIQGP